MSVPIPGAVMGPVDVTPSRESLVRYAAASGDFAPLHYDEPYARSRGFPTVLVHGMLKAGYLATLLGDWLPPGATVRRFAMRYLRPDLPDATLRCHGVVAEVVVGDEGWDAVVELWVENAAGERSVAGNALVRIPAGVGGVQESAG